MSKLSRRKAGRADIPGPVTSTQKPLSDDFGTDDEVEEKYVARARRPPGDRDEELFQKQLEAAIQQSSTGGPDEEPKPGPSGLQQKRKAAASAAAAKKAWMDESKEEEDEEEVLPLKNPTPPKNLAKSEEKTRVPETRVPEARVPETVPKNDDKSEKVVESEISNETEKPIILKISLTKPTPALDDPDSKEDVHSSKRTPAPSKKKKANDSDFDAAPESSDDEYSPFSNTTKSKSTKNSKTDSKKVKVPTTDPEPKEEVRSSKRTPAPSRNKKANDCDVEAAPESSDDEYSPFSNTTKSKSTKNIKTDSKKGKVSTTDSEPKEEVRSSRRTPAPSRNKKANDSDFEAAPESSDDEYSPFSNKTKSKKKTEPKNGKVPTPPSGGRSKRNVKKKAGVIDFDDNSDDEKVPLKSTSAAKSSTAKSPAKNNTNPIKAHAAAGQEKGDAPPAAPSAPSGGRSKRSLSKKKLVDSDSSGGSETDESDDEFAPAKKKPKPALGSAKPAGKPVGKPVGKMGVKKTPVGKQTESRNVGGNEPKVNENTKPRRSFSAPLKLTSAAAADGCDAVAAVVPPTPMTGAVIPRTVLTPKWNPPAMVKSASSPATATSGPPTPLIGMRLGLSRNLKTKPLHSNVKWNA